MKEKQHEQQVGNISSYFRQTMRFMRLSLFFMVVSTTMAFSAATYSQNTKLSVNLEDATAVSYTHLDTDNILFYLLKSFRRKSVSYTHLDVYKRQWCLYANRLKAHG